MIVIIKYNAGNITSVKNAVERQGFACKISGDPEEIRSADKVIFPGVGEAGSAMKYLKEHKLDQLIPTLQQPFLGICLGLQLMCNHSAEADTQCMGIFDTSVQAFPPLDIVPHMGWNNLENPTGLLYQEITAQDDVYFVHGFYAGICPDTTAVCNYILPFSASLQKNNFYATQFHPERSGSVGETILSNFLKL